MYLSSHVLLGMALFGRGDAPRRTAASAAGAAVPDLMSMGLVLWATWVLGAGPEAIYRELYPSEAWQRLLAPWHALPVWGVLLLAAVASRRPTARAGAAAGVLHVLCDAPTHAARPHAHLWPLTDARWASPVSYWHPEHGGAVLQPIEAGLGIGLTALLWRRHRSPAMAGALAALWLAYAAQFASYVRIDG